MMIWFYLIVLSASAGFITAIIFSGKIGLIISGAIPWFGLLTWLLYNEYFVPYQGGGASMWPVAQLFAGTVAAAIGAGSYTLCKYIMKSKNEDN